MADSTGASPGNSAAADTIAESKIVACIKAAPEAGLGTCGKHSFAEFLGICHKSAQINPAGHLKSGKTGSAGILRRFFLFLRFRLVRNTVIVVINGIVIDAIAVQIDKLGLSIGLIGRQI